MAAQTAVSPAALAVETSHASLWLPSPHPPQKKHKRAAKEGEPATYGTATGLRFAGRKGGEPFAWTATDEAGWVMDLPLGGGAASEGGQPVEWWAWVKVWRPTEHNAFRSHGFILEGDTEYQVWDVAQKRTSCSQRPLEPWAKQIENDVTGVWMRAGRSWAQPQTPGKSEAPLRWKWGSVKDGNAWSLGASEFLFTTDPTDDPARA
eukprot:CAMPEP_0172605858 /NCGR_PEP_ID=MMETSP1068-20121228/26055_1 /TAXON_ID=35684 /ORGANISM="Pseudopedinella elastica, Strain CCMP716" /LENGTH=205 /DNA_ID=CAMNT_0013408375 /DNA_START=1 /DNA_END=615 /DNA_ORIENTATION=+